MCIVGSDGFFISTTRGMRLAHFGRRIALERSPRALPLKLPNRLVGWDSISSLTFQSKETETGAADRLSRFDRLGFSKEQQSSPSTRSSSTASASAVPLDRLPTMTGSVGNDASDLTTNASPYEVWVRRLYTTNLFHPVKMGLDNMERLHELMGRCMDEESSVAVVHIAGTNGKGSVALKIARALEFSNPNLKVGLFCSPHVSSFRERIQVNGRLISEEQVVEYLPQIYQYCRQYDIPATFFEITTALAFLFYAKEKANVVVLETGLGGRLDATNVIRQPALSVITSIGLEHTKILGNTIELIAKEKAGIIKAGRPVLVGPNVPHDVLRQCALEKKADGYYSCEDVLGNAEDSSKNDEIVDYDLENARIAAAALKLLEKVRPDLGQISDRAIQLGTAQRPPCRFEELQCKVTSEKGHMRTLTVILDVAHNPPAMEYMVRKLKLTYPDVKVRVVVGMSADKDLHQCGQSILKAVEGDATRIHLVEAAHARAACIETILKATGLHGAHFDFQDRSITKQIELARELATKNEEDILVVCGSVFIMAEAREALGINEPRDSDYISQVAGTGARHGQENFGNTDTSSPSA